MYCLVVKYNTDGSLIGENFGEVGKDFQLWNLDNIIYESKRSVIPKEIESKLEELIKRDPDKEFYELFERHIYGGKTRFYFLDELKNPIEEDSEEKKIAERLIRYFKINSAPDGI